MKSISTKLTKTRILFILLTISVMVMIFFFSSENSSDSSNTSGNVVRMILKAFVRNFDDFPTAKQLSMIKSAQHIVRKLAHFTIYAVLGFCVSFSFGKRKFLSRQTLESLMVGFIYAVSDELHQSHVPGRSCEFKDVMIDTSGTMTGIFISFVMIAVIHYLSKRVHKPKIEER